MNKKERIKKDAISVFGFIFLHKKLLIFIPFQIFAILTLLKMLIQKAFPGIGIMGIYLIEFFLRTLPSAVIIYGFILMIDMLFNENSFDPDIFKERFIKNYQNGILILVLYFTLSQIGHAIILVLGVFISAKLLLAPFFVIFENLPVKRALEKSFSFKMMKGNGLLMYKTLVVLSIPLVVAILVSIIVLIVSDNLEMILLYNINQFLISFYSVVYWIAAYMYFLRFKNDLEEVVQHDFK